MGVDLGDRRIGVAVSDPSQWIASGLTVLRRTSLDRDLAALAELIRQYEVETVVIGLPRTLEGAIGPQAKKVKAFASEARRRLGVKVVLWDERLSTAEAEELMIEAGISREKRREKIDQVAASLILQSYLDHLAEQRRASGERRGRGSDEETVI